ncbi:MAG: hypothetical protein COV31_02795 [Candidatus Yanofskybacteria bacterium CG10_big_fil_rev_8_21_14_0_10_46_23]|uniref:UDP-N-acetylmuramoyl-tripeptide--D-alanyl-D-alanine ligase n=1 Tax=Candidatus Yanofskybacteria bacterium CG10_big_fil_rev_8_21_14_0_10_46_23 TaxID=1975098 RepID=A0A2H0R3P9_9BACT|nr:MAG: hypothetical protein COV31_02795 [Candidatus Yanofskybacteria bacterium CG10_big_fil_rev_8_21_14_0_10_46_23]
MKNFFQTILIFIARLYLIRYQPKIVAVTGNVGKTSAKVAIGAVLSHGFGQDKVRVSQGNLNNELGVPLTIIGNYDQEYYQRGRQIRFWLKILFLGFLGLIFKRHYPKILVLEFGADRPGDISRLAKNFKPDIGVVTAIGQIPVHVEFFSQPSDLAHEKSQLVRALGAEDLAVLNADDDLVLNMKTKTRADVLTFGFSPTAEIKILNFKTQINNLRKPVGVSFEIEYKNQIVPVSLRGSLGKGLAYASSTAVAVGLGFKIDLDVISHALNQHYRGPAGRLRILEGVKNTLIIDDTYNSAPSSTELALKTLQNIPASRRVVVLGDMLELGEYTPQAHLDAGVLAGGVADVLVCVGNRAVLIADGASGKMKPDKIFTFSTADEAKKKVQDLLWENDLILVKGSQGIRMEKIVEEIMAHPEQKKDLLVRQTKIWQNK